MEIHHLEYFLEVARYHNFSHAAEAIHISQPTLSRVVREMENELGRPLFRRLQHDVALTDFGEEFLQKAQDVITAFRNLPLKQNQDPQQLRGKVYIGIPPITAATSFGRFLGGFRKQYPMIELVLLEYAPRQVRTMLRNGLIDFGIFKPHDPLLYKACWFEKDLHGVVLPADHLLAREKSLTYQDLQEEPLIIYNRDYLLHDKILHRFQQHHISPRIAFESTQQDLMLMLVRAGCGAAILPRKLCRHLAAGTPDLVFRPLEDQELTLSLAVTSMKDKKLSAEAELFRRFVEQTVARDRERR